MSQLDAVVFQERREDKSLWVAVLMNHFLVGEGDTPAQAITELRLVIEQTVTANQRDGVAAFNGLKPAPQEYVRAHPGDTVIEDTGTVGGYSFELHGREAA